MKRIYWNTVKKWVVGAPIGIAGFTLLFFYLSALGTIDITAHSGDMVCDGTIKDPCYAYINFTAKEDIFIYPMDYDPYGRDTPFYTDSELSSWKMYRSWGSGWREIKLNETCTGTWCGAPNSNGVAYSFVFRKGRDYQIKIEALKKNPDDNIKWGFGPVDPVWYGEYYDSIKIYDFSKNKFTIKNKDSNLIIQAQRLTPQNNYIIDVGKGVLQVVAKYNLSDFDKTKKNVFTKTEFYNLNKKMKKEERYFEWRWKNTSSHLETNYRRDCSTELVWNDVNKTNDEVETCVLVEDGKKEVYDYEWIKFTELSEIEKGVEVGLFVDVLRGEHIEYIPTFAGVEITEDAEWTESLNVGLVSYWAHEDASGATLTDNVSSNDGVIDGADWSASGLNGYALDYVSANTDYTKIDESVSIYNSNTFSIFLWVNSDSNTESSILCARWGDGSGDSNHLATRADGGYYWALDTGDGLKVVEPVPDLIPSAGEWHSFAMVYNGVNATLYYDGVEQNDAEATTGAFSTTRPIIFGAYDDLTGGWLNGLIDEVGWWNRTLSLSEIEQLHNSGNGITWTDEFGNPAVNYYVALPLGVLRFLNCSPDWENADSRPDGQTTTIAAINATNNGTATGNFIINLTGSLNNGWTIWASNDSLINNITLSTTAQTIWSNVNVNETKKIWLAANCSFISANPGQSISMQAV